MKMKRQPLSRDRALEKLRELAERMLIGSASETYRTCGQPSCRCHSSGPKHGPNVYVSYRGEHGKTTGYYVPKLLHEPVYEGLAAWTEFHELAKQVAHLNEQLLRASVHKPARQPRRRTR
jgi:uncharacterized protein DUF6788